MATGMALGASWWGVDVPNVGRGLYLYFYFLWRLFICVNLSDLWSHIFCGGGSCGCVSLNIFFASFSLFSLALRHCNLCFWEHVSPDGQHRGMEYFGSYVFLVAPMSFSSFVLVDLPKIIGPSFLSCMTTSIMPILMTSPFVILLAFCIGSYNCRHFLPVTPAWLVGLCGRAFQ